MKETILHSAHCLKLRLSCRYPLLTNTPLINVDVFNLFFFFFFLTCQQCITFRTTQGQQCRQKKKKMMQEAKRWNLTKQKGNSHDKKSTKSSAVDSTQSDSWLCANDFCSRVI
jgi:hypothetical protein